jgi:hypothetical protein
MQISSLKNAALFLFGVLTLFPIPSTGDHSSPNSTGGPTVVRVDQTARGILYKVDSKPTGSTPTTDLLHTLNRIRAERGESTPVMVIIDSRVPINEIWNLSGVAGKAQLTNLRYFIHFHETEMMSEIKPMPAVPFSTNLPPS